MKYIQTTLNVNDLDKSLEFYRDLIGLSLINKIEVQGKQIAFLGEGETKIELICDGIKRSGDIKDGISIGFACESLEETLFKFKSLGLELISDIIEPNPHIKFVLLKDPDGNVIQVAELMN